MEESSSRQTYKARAQEKVWPGVQGQVHLYGGGRLMSG